MALRDLAALLNGPQTIGRGAGFWSVAVLVMVLAAIYPLYAEPFAIANTAYFGVWVFMALGLGLLWGYGGMLSFGQTAFFGLAGYAYGVIAINLGAAHSYPLLALVCALAIGTAFAALLGYFMIYGGINGVFVGIVTLSVTLAFATFMNQTAGPEWRIGRARLNGYNGMTRIPSLSIDWFDGHRIKFDGANFYYLVLVLLVVTYLALRVLVNSRFGNVLVASRENPERAELLGYAIRRYQLAAFAIGGFLASLSGALYAAWGNFIVPASMALPAAAMPIIWVAVGGRQDVTATLIGTFVVLYAFQMLTVVSQQYALIAIGALAGGDGAGGAGRLRAVGRGYGGPLASPLRGPAGRGGDASPGGGASWRRRKRAGLVAKLLETRGLTKRFGGVTAIDNLDFSVDEGGLHCLIGPNGAGKSTLFKLIVGRITPTEGSIWFRGRDITALPTSERIRAGISIKMQVPGIFPELPVAQNLTIALQRHHSRAETRREVDRLLRLR